MEKINLIGAFAFVLVCLFIITRISNGWDWYHNLIALGIMIMMTLLIIEGGQNRRVKSEEG